MSNIPNLDDLTTAEKLERLDIVYADREMSWVGHLLELEPEDAIKQEIARREHNNRTNARKAKSLIEKRDTIIAEMGSEDDTQKWFDLREKAEAAQDSINLSSFWMVDKKYSNLCPDLIAQ